MHTMNKLRHSLTTNSMQGLSSVFNLHGLGCFLPLNVKLHCARSIYHCIMSVIHSCCITEIFPFGDIQYVSGLICANRGTKIGIKIPLNDTSFPFMKQKLDSNHCAVPPLQKEEWIVPNPIFPERPSVFWQSLRHLY
jgi:hypothetical protein